MKNNSGIPEKRKEEREVKVNDRKRKQDAAANRSGK
jgi:hypothetical protein